MDDERIKIAMAVRDSALVIMPCQDGSFTVTVVDRTQVSCPLEYVEAVANDACPIKATRIAMRRACGGAA